MRKKSLVLLLSAVIMAGSTGFALAKQAPANATKATDAGTHFGLTPEKREAAYKIVRDYHEKTTPTRQALMSKKMQLDAMRGNSSINAAAISSVADEAARLQIELEKEQRAAMDLLKKEVGPGAAHWFGMRMMHDGGMMGGCMSGGMGGMMNGGMGGMMNGGMGGMMNGGIKGHDMLDGHGMKGQNMGQNMGMKSQSMDQSMTDDSSQDN